MTGSLNDVKHVVVLMQENRSFDHYFGSMSGVRGFGDRAAAPLGNGRNVIWQPHGPPSRGEFLAPFRLMEGGADFVGLPHEWFDQHQAIANGKNNAWTVAKGSGMTMGYFTQADIPFHHSLADAFTICDHYFCSAQASTTPNRLHLFTGMLDADSQFGGPCMAEPPDYYAPVFNWTTYPERLQSAGISWRVYANKEAGNDWLGDFGDNPLWLFKPYHDSLKNPARDSLADRAGLFVRPGPLGPSRPTAEHVLSEFLSDCAAGTLPAVSWVVSPFLFSEHPPGRPADGEQYVYTALQAIWTNPELWKSTVVFVTYDENDGFFDHIVPPMPPDGTVGEFINGEVVGLGARVPMTIVSPWTLGGWVNSQVADHTSILRFLERWTGIKEPNISAWRRKICGDLLSCFDFTTPNLVVPTLNGPAASSMPLQSQPTVPPEAEQRRPRQDSGSRPARPLPYALEARGHVASDKFTIDIQNAGEAMACLYVYANASSGDGPWRYSIDAGETATDHWEGGDPTGAYDLSLIGPNGFLRRFRGNRVKAISSGAANPEVHAEVDPGQDKIILSMTNSGDAGCEITITSNLGGPTVVWVEQGSTLQRTWMPSVASNWYDIVVTAATSDRFLRRFAGHIENGKPSVTDQFDRFQGDFPIDP